MLLGDGLGYLSGLTDFSAGTYPWSVAAGDVNGDGKIDLVTANRYGNDVSVLLGDGLGGFGAAQNYAVGSEPTSVVLGDFNHDSKLDIATANFAGNDVSVLQGDGDGTFSAAVNSAAGPGRLCGGGRRLQRRRLARRGHGQCQREQRLGPDQHAELAGVPGQRLPLAATAGEAHTITLTAGKRRPGAHRLHRHGPLQQQRPPGRPPRRLHLHGRRQRHAHLHRHAEDGRHAVAHGQRHDQPDHDARRATSSTSGIPAMVSSALPGSRD